MTERWGLPVKFDGIPEKLQYLCRWCVWQARPRPGKPGKYDKIPYSPTSRRKISTGRPSQWGEYEDAVAAYETDKFSGLGILVEPGLIVIDQDNSVTEAGLTPVAQALQGTLGGHAELSPSGKGLRKIFFGTLPGQDVVSPEIEIYGGSSPRFVTITGNALPGCRKTSRASEELLQLYAQHRKAQTDAKVTDAPEPLDDADIPELHDRIPEEHVDYLNDGYPHDCDRSGRLQRTTKCLYGAGFDDREVYSVLLGSEGAMQIVLDHRHGDYDKALSYLWKQCLDAQASRVAHLDDFPDETNLAKGTEEKKAPNGNVCPIVELITSRKPPPLEWLVPDLIIHGRAGALVAPGGTGKSFFQLQLAMAIATGGMFLGHWQVPKPGGVLYVTAEEEAQDLHRRGHAIFNQMTAFMEPGEKEHVARLLHRNLKLVSTVGLNVMLTEQDDAGKVVILEKTIEQIATRVNALYDPRLLMMDPAAQYRGGDENSNADTTMFVKAIERLRQECDVSLQMAHHSNKAAMREGGALDQHAARGGAAFTDNLRYQINMALMPPQIARRYNIPDDDIPQHVCFATAKMNYGPRSGVSHWMRRGQHGVLQYDELAAPADSQAAAENAILELVQTRMEGGHPVTRRQIRDHYSGRDNDGGWRQIPIASRSAYDLVGDMVEAGKLIEVPLPGTSRGVGLALPSRGE